MDNLDDKTDLHLDMLHAARATSDSRARLPQPSQDDRENAAELIRRFLRFARETGPPGAPRLTHEDILGCTMTRLFFEYLIPGRRPACPENQAQARLQAMRDVASVAPGEIMDSGGFAFYSTESDGSVAVILLPHNLSRWAQVLSPDRIPKTEREVVLRQLAEAGEILPKLSDGAKAAALRQMRRQHDGWARKEANAAGSALPAESDFEGLASELTPLTNSRMVRRDKNGQYHLDSRAMRDALRRVEHTVEHTVPMASDLEATDVLAAAHASADLPVVFDALHALVRDRDRPVLEAMRDLAEAGESPASATAIADRLGCPESTARGAVKRIRETAKRADLGYVA